jgi:hypothetical protein
MTTLDMTLDLDGRIAEGFVSYLYCTTSADKRSREEEIRNSTSLIFGSEKALLINPFSDRLL